MISLMIILQNFLIKLSKLIQIKSVTRCNQKLGNKIAFFKNVSPFYFPKIKILEQF